MAKPKTKSRSKTAVKQQKKPMPRGVPFKPNDPETGEKDERINRAGRTLGAGFDSLRKMALEIAQETALDRYGKPVLAPDGKTPMTIGETILRMMAQDPKRQQAFLEISNGKPQEIIHHLLQNIDLAMLTEEQLGRVAAGEDIVTVLLTTQGARGAGTSQTPEDG